MRSFLILFALLVTFGAYATTYKALIEEPIPHPEGVDCTPNTETVMNVTAAPITAIGEMGSADTCSAFVGTITNAYVTQRNGKQNRYCDSELNMHIDTAQDPGQPKLINWACTGTCTAKGKTYRKCTTCPRGACD